MTKTDLEQIYYLSRELRLLETELERLRGESLVQSPLPSVSHGSGIADKVAQRGNRIADLEQLISEKREEIQRQRDRAVEYIYSIPDSLTRQIVYYRCVKLYSWRRVAYAVGGYNTAESVRKIYTRFFNCER